MVSTALLAPARAGAAPPAAMLARALERAALDRADPEPRRLAARFVPSLDVAVAVARSHAPGQSTWAIEVLARLGWPLGAIGAGDARAAIGPSLKRARRREELTEQVAEKWRIVEETRRVLERRPAAVDAQLDADEAAAELEALTGEAP